MVSPPPLKRVTVRAAVEEYLKGVARATLSGSLSPATQSNYQRDLAEFVSLVGAEQILDDLTAEDIDDIILAYASRPDKRFTRNQKSNQELGAPGRGPGAQARFKASISRLFTYAVRKGFVQQDPIPDTVVRPRGRNLREASRTALTEPAAVALLDSANHKNARRSDQQLSLRDTAILRILMEVGPRVFELCALNQSDIEVREETTWLVVRKGKGGKRRDLPLSPATASAIELYLKSARPQISDTEENRDDHLKAMFLTFRGRRIKPRDVQYLVARAVKRLPLSVQRDVTPHGLRHTAASLLLASGAADVKTVQAILGHASLATTGIYLDETSQEMIQAVRQHPVTGKP